MRNLKKVVIYLLLLTSNVIFATSNSETNNNSNSFLQITDYRGREVVLASEPQRVISLAPNITETIFKLGAEDKLVGRTDYCDYPVEVDKIESIGTLLQPSIEKIVELNPDVIIASTHFSNELLTKLENIKLKVIIIDELGSLEGLYSNILDVGSIVNKKDQANLVVNNLKSRIEELSNMVKDLDKPSLYYVISYGEYGDFTSGGDTFISQLLELSGGINIAKDSMGWSYSLEKIVEKNPDIIICSKYYNTLQGIKSATGYKELPAVKNNRVYEIDNNLIDRQGPRVGDGLEALIKIVHPELF
ncbi:ABC transporter substrate-binding protein [Thiospirochaeta perfilievii]|uniref:ABC transporter substrate-binding protein n=1 Tax=Thiospirochaeta perfilievii TaxID=252967 RepID=A0A5C1QFU0_9SPIO|nr:ABC transporter substrate-binding protein [Thiospirochaeta perfilievii]QEN06010.1 ABC transporter substrate-binding protein [Thiospirochaeta perfilievii]